MSRRIRNIFRAYLADTLKNVDSLLEISDMEDGKLKLYVPEVAWTDLKRFLTSFTFFAFLADTKTQVKWTSFEHLWRVSVWMINSFVHYFDLCTLLDISRHHQPELN